MVPAVPQRMILDDELRSHRVTEAEPEGRRAVKLFIRERPNYSGALRLLRRRMSGSEWSACLELNTHRGLPFLEELGIPKWHCWPR
jgi:hypothetical protein